MEGYGAGRRPGREQCAGNDDAVPVGRPRVELGRWRELCNSMQTRSTATDWFRVVLALSSRVAVVAVGNQSGARVPFDPRSRAHSLTCSRPLFFRMFQSKHGICREQISPPVPNHDVLSNRPIVEQNLVSVVSAVFALTAYTHDAPWNLLCENMPPCPVPVSTKPEVYNLSQRRQRRIGSTESVKRLISVHYDMSFFKAIDESSRSCRRIMLLKWSVRRRCRAF